jgi:hypothetical protein
MECTCNNGTAPGLEYYDQSLYSFVCREAFNQCNENNAGDATELKKCVTDIRDRCGTLTIAAAQATAESSNTASSDATATGDSSASSTSNPGSTPTAFPGAAVLAVGLAAILI